WDVHKPAAPSLFKDDLVKVWGTAFSPDGTRLAAAGLGPGDGGRGGGTVRVWDLASGRTLLPLRAHPRDAWAVAFSPAGKLLASAGSVFGNQLGQVKVWDLATGQEVWAFEGSLGRVWALAFSPDGKFLASPSGTGQVKVWNLQTGQEVAAIKGDLSYVHA